MEDRTLLSAGALDPTYENGRITGGARFIDVSGELVQPDQKVVVVGTGYDAVQPVTHQDDRIVLARFNVDGSPDSTFGIGGIVTSRYWWDSYATSAYAAALQPDGKILVAGSVAGSVSAIARYNNDGSLDTSFGNGGWVLPPEETYGFMRSAQTVGVQSDGKIVITGPSTYNTIPLARYNADGSPDSEFGVGGIQLVYVEEGAQIKALGFEPDGKIVVAGRVGSDAYDFLVARFNVDGSLDQTFGGSGFRCADFGGGSDDANALVIQPDGKILVGGTTRERLPWELGDPDFAMTRFNVDGGLDETFGTFGLVTTDFGSASVLSNDYANALVIDRDGKILLAGSTGDRRTAIARYNPDGSLDADFGDNGMLLTTTIPGASGAVRAAIQPDGRIVIVSPWFAWSYYPEGFTLARYLPGSVGFYDNGDSAGKVLIAAGTSGDDRIHFTPDDLGDGIEVTINAVAYGAFNADRLIAMGEGGDDWIEAAGGITASAWFFGGEGNDRLKGGGGNNVLVGGTGDDLLVGGSARDLLIGGGGADRLVGSAQDDILISGTTDHDTRALALAAIMNEWTSARTYVERTANLFGNGTGDRANGLVFLTLDRYWCDEYMGEWQIATGTVHDDDASDVLTGSAGQDWFFANMVLGSETPDNATQKDKITDLHAAEFAPDLDWILSY